MQELKEKARYLPSLLQIGKLGVTDNFIRELSTMINAKELVKVQLLRSYADNHKTVTTAQDLAGRINATVVSVTGNTIVLYKKKSSQTKKN